MSNQSSKYKWMWIWVPGFLFKDLRSMAFYYLKDPIIFILLLPYLTIYFYFFKRYTFIFVHLTTFESLSICLMCFFIAMQGLILYYKPSHQYIEWVEELVLHFILCISTFLIWYNLEIEFTFFIPTASQLLREQCW